ncbi:DNA mismatch repair endonuclease MutL [Shewanella psychrotolerans]|uniref:DNA mismatch repair endonuclease MutL n=1 Tax=Shewanella psychrotolerans TaxID=2864206 RepID=UPI001C65E58B|nr:DNA mismatch repair endonuclease MutL [Shewanella psychrotolerans]QYK01922.1 DNA mismatch repair endonuclease MutL [Shewanella psychrotolerans]
MSIKILPPQLANQIAAGEVVERPASVIKELVENSLDAGATRVDIEIDKGGSKLIKIQDNGSGIPKEQLNLALSRHATSKLATLDDLDAILSFGFRGEALASISSVSRLTLTSRTAEQAEAWQAYAEGSDMAVKVIPAAHPVGSTVEAVDLFFNTPARRRFLKSDKTEFTHIDEWLKRIALVRRDIHFTLKHNGKMVRHYRPAKNEQQYLQRLAQISGKQFAEHALAVDCEHNGLQLTGYIQSPYFEASANDTQYFYVNGRLVRDRLVNHAVRQAFAQQLEGVQVGYVLMLNLDPHQVDVNVHPAKHEVRFHESRYVHDFILQALQSALSQAEQLPLGVTNEPCGFELDKEDDDQYETEVINACSSEPPISHRQRDTSLSWSAPTAGVRERASAYSGDYSNHGARTDNYRAPELPSQTAINNYAQLMTTPNARVIEDKPVQGKAMPAVLAGKFWVVTEADELRLISFSMVADEVVRSQISSKLSSGLVGQPLLMPVSIKLDEDWQDTIAQRALLIRKLGIELTIRLGQLIIKKVPPYLRQSQLANVIPEFLQWIRFEEPADEAITNWLVTQSRANFSSAAALWTDFCQLSESQQQHIMSESKVLPWQNWLGEQTSE